MDHFSYKNGELHAEDVPIRKIVEAVGTPFYCYSTATIQRHFKVFSDSVEGLDALVCYAMKANGNLAILRTLGNMGAGADVVSAGEMERALTAGIPADRIVFSGVGKTADELARAVDAGIMQINVESEPELEALSAIASSKGCDVTVSIRVNPDVDAKTHEKITTGKSDNKFGIDIGKAREVFSRAALLPGISPVGIAMHIGSQLRDLAPFRTAYESGAELVDQLRQDGHTIDRIDLGGGLGIPYFEVEGESAPPSPKEYGTMVKAVVGNLGCKVMLEPGRVIMGNAGILVSSVVYVKQGPSKRFIILDAAMNDLIRPSFYNAHHAIMTVKEPAADANYENADVVGPICETGDTFARERPMPPLMDGDTLAFKSAGAYGAVMSSFYNARPLVPEVLVNGDSFAVIRRRIEVADLLAYEDMPDWLNPDQVSDPALGDKKAVR